MFKTKSSKISHTNAELVCTPSCSGVNLKRNKKGLAINHIKNISYFKIQNFSVYFQKNLYWYRNISLVAYNIMNIHLNLHAISFFPPAVIYKKFFLSFGK
jgi:hypothetical protein